MKSNPNQVVYTPKYQGSKTHHKFVYALERLLFAYRILKTLNGTRTL